MTSPTRPLFSVVIPTYNRAPLLSDTLRSVFEQRFTDFNVIIVDDGSTDETDDVLEAYRGRVTVCRQDRRGPGAARNLGGRHADGEYLAFLDSDDVWFPWTLDIYAQALYQAAQPAFLAGAPTYFGALDELRDVSETPLSTEVFADYYASQEAWRWWGASAFVIRSDAFRAAGGFTEAWINGEDADLAMRLGVSSGFVHVSGPSTFGYRRHADTAMGNFDRTCAGAWHILSMEHDGGYPGGEGRALERRRILGRQLRSVMLDAVREERGADAWRLYRATFGWHVRLHRWRFLLAFPLLAAWRAVPARLTRQDSTK